MKNIDMPELARLSSKGQLVIPKEYRDEMELKEGSVVSIISVDGMLVLKKVTSKLKEKELELLNEIKDSWEEIERGDFVRMSKKNFLRELNKW